MEQAEFSLLVFVKQFMQDGGLFMWIILFSWILGLAFSIYKFITLKAYSVNGKQLFDMIKAKVLANNVEEAVQLCSNSKAVLPNILKSGLQRANEERILIEDAVNSSISEQAPKLNYYLPYINLVANISTLLGLLGTIQGLIMSFAGVASAEPGMKAKILSMGIAKAMNTTAFGLVSAITIMVLYTVLSQRVGKLADDIDEYTSKLIDLLSVKKKKGVE